MVEELTKDSIKKKIGKDSSKPIIIDFYGDWCIPCKTFAPVFGKISKEFKTITFARYNVDEDNKVTAIKLGIASVPSTIAFFKGEEIERFTGALPEEELREKIKEILKRLEQ